MRRISRFFLICLFAICALSNNLYAGIGVDPSIIEIKVERNIKYEGAWKVVNTGSKIANFNVVFENWLRKEIPPENWLNIETKEFILGPGESKDIKFIISVPKDATGELAAMVFFNSMEEGATIGAGFGIPVYATINGTEMVEAEIIDVNIEYADGQNLQGWVVIENKGNVHIRPRTSIQLFENKGKAVAYFRVKYGLPTHAYRTRKYDFLEGKVKLEPGRYKVVVKTSYGDLYDVRGECIKETRLVVKGKTERIRGGRFLKRRW